EVEDDGPDQQHRRQQLEVVPELRQPVHDGHDGLLETEMPGGKEGSKRGAEIGEEVERRAGAVPTLDQRDPSETVAGTASKCRSPARNRLGPKPSARRRRFKRLNRIDRILSMAPSKARGSPGGRYSTPCSPDATMSRTPPMPRATTGVPQARASTAEMPKSS